MTRVHACSQKAFVLFVFFTLLGGALRADQVRTQAGIVEGAASADARIRVFKGIPFAAPPVGPLRWKPPQPAPPWTGVRNATQFGARCMQGRIFEDMVFRDNGPSEDCLYLNVWTPAKSSQARLPVMVWIYGGAFVAGSASEPRQDGENLARKGVVVVSFNYRLAIFGFFSHPDLARESGRNSSGNYGLLDQVAALQWVQNNIAAFGGDPHNVTLFGESAGSLSVSAVMASPLAQGLFQRAIGESGSYLGTSLEVKPLAQSEEAGAKFAASLGAHSLGALRSLPADQLLQAALKQGAFRFLPNLDGYFLPEDPVSIYASGKQCHVPLLAGWNADEGNYQALFGAAEPTVQTFVEKARVLFGGRAGEFLKLYPAENDAQARRSAQDLAGDRFMAHSTWKWLELHAATGNSPVFRYQFDDAPPLPAVASAKAGLPAAGGASHPQGAYHSAEIEFVFRTLPSKNLPWRPEDEKLSDLISTFWTNFAKFGDPNGPGLPAEALAKAGLPYWPAYTSKENYPVMHLGANSRSAPDSRRQRYLFLDSLSPRKQP